MRNKIINVDKGVLTESDSPLIEPGRKYKIVVEFTDKMIRQFIDGKEILKTPVISWAKVNYFGFYIWNSGSINEVKVYMKDIPLQVSKKNSGEMIEKNHKVRKLWTFNDCLPGALPTEFTSKNAKNCSAGIENLPTWLYHSEGPKDDKTRQTNNNGARFVKDYCIKLADNDKRPDKNASFDFQAPPMSSGLIEFDIMADSYAGDVLRVMLSDDVSLLIDQNGTFFWQAMNSKTKLRDRVVYPGHRGTRLYFQKNKWYTVRIDFDTNESLANVVIVNLYQPLQYGSMAKNPVPRYFTIGADLPLPLDAVEKVRFETVDKSVLYLDNIFLVSRTSDLMEENKWQVAAAEIMPLYYPKRKDPFNIYHSSRRNVHNRLCTSSAGDERCDLQVHKDKYQGILECADKYNTVMLSQAFLQEKLRELERAYFYLTCRSNRSASKYKSRLKSIRNMANDSFVELDDLYRFYAECYLDKLNEKKLLQGFDKRHIKLKSLIDETDKKIEVLIQEMRLISKKRIPSFRKVSNLKRVEKNSSLSADKRFLFLYAGGGIGKNMYDQLLLSRCTPSGGHFWGPVENAPYPDAVDHSALKEILTRCFKNQGPSFCWNITTGQHHNHSLFPKWWFEKNKHDPEIFLQNSKGQYEKKDKNGNSSYNHWHPKVREIQKRIVQELCEENKLYGAAFAKMFVLGGECYHSISIKGKQWETGYNKNAIIAFREYLKRIYDNIGNLNKKWRTDYSGFNDIQSPPDAREVVRKVPSGLGYEFERFRQYSWFDWMGISKDVVKNNYSDMPVANYQQQYMFGTDYFNGFDSIKVFDTFDIITDHSAVARISSSSMYRYMDSLNKVFKKAMGIMEWHMYTEELYDETNSLNEGLRASFLMTSWGRSVLCHWLGNWATFTDEGNWVEPRLGDTVFRYWASYIPIGNTRAMENAHVFLECPTVAADVAILESQASFYNDFPVGSVRLTLAHLGNMLEKKGHNYEFLFEELILDGRQKLDGYKIIILPNARSMPDAMVHKLMDWVKKGGVLVASGLIGVWDQYGNKDGRLLDLAVGAKKWELDEKKSTLSFNVDNKSEKSPKILWQNSSQTHYLIECNVGKGIIYLSKKASKAKIYNLVKKHAPRLFYGKDLKFNLIMRKGKDCLYLTVFNVDKEKPREDEIVVKGSFPYVFDTNNDFPISVVRKDGFTRFKVRLAPCEGIVLRLKK